MECCECNRKPIENNLSMIPIEPPGTTNRKWICTECATKEQKQTVPKDVRELCNIINPESGITSEIEEKEIFADMIMDMLIIINLDGVVEDKTKENRMRFDLLNADWDKLNDYYQKADELVKSKYRQDRIERILKEVEEIGVEAVKEKYGLS